MSKRRTHSSIDKLPEPLRAALTRMIVDHEWPADFPGEPPGGKHEGSPRYEDCALYCTTQGLSVSKSAIGRWGKGLRVIEIMKTANLIAGKMMANMTGEDAPKAQKGAAQMMTALTLDFMVTHEDLGAKEMKDVAQTIRDCAQVAINADKYIRSQIAEKVKTADSKITTIAKKKNIDPEVLKQIREEVYGIMK